MYIKTSEADMYKLNKSKRFLDISILTLPNNVTIDIALNSLFL